MAATSSSVVTVHPDGDLVLLLELMPIHEPHKSSLKPQINVPNAKVFSPEAASSPGETQNGCTKRIHAMLTGDSKEAVELREKGRTEIPLPDDDACVMITIAILVDKYQCHESTEFVVKVWTVKYRVSPWSRSWYFAAYWIFVAWMFGLDDEFKEATEKIIRQSDMGLGAILRDYNLALPITERVINKIDERRKNAVSQLIDVLKDTISRYQGQTLICPNHSLPVLDIISHRETCDATVLGSLIKSVTKKKLFPLPEAPFKDPLRYHVVKSSIASLEPQTACNVLVQDESLHHNVMGIIGQSIESIDDNISGLSLADCK
ncbi:uncharacterized protein EAF01_006646 [Botrytis porri]|uniref:uncharacterized protein n=1 Tax=Botrytis porri TaxID=87229 RepID=UPI001901E26D|nr:uncharacterized protein EAF01_006646 [Botrytis porri]KAF7903597.1 hypothetical protein EAF01_006646 [Botrytis porri]